MSRPSGGSSRLRARGPGPVLALLTALALSVAACGKSDLRTGSGRREAPSGASAAPRTPPPAGAPGGPTASTPHHSKPAKAIPQTGVPVPLALSTAHAASFARAVQLTLADVVGGRAQPHSATPRSEEEEAAKCAASRDGGFGGARSADFARGRGLEREEISSSIQVLSSEAAVRRDLEYAQSKQGLRCFARIVGRNAVSKAEQHVRLIGLDVATITVDLPAGLRAAGLRIAARVGVPGTRAQVSMFSDALSLGYGPAELNLYATSFVQPAPLRTEQQLLELMRERALRARL